MKLCLKNFESIFSIHNKPFKNKQFLNLFQRTFITTSSNNFNIQNNDKIQNNESIKTELYMWNSSVIPGRKKSDYSSRFNFTHIPTKINFFDGKNPKQVFTSPRHYGVITEDGNLYTFGDGFKGILGHGNDMKISYKKPKLVTYFAENNIKIKKVFFGDCHSLALSEEGDLYSWGYGGKLKGIFSFYKGKDFCYRNNF